MHKQAEWALPSGSAQYGRSLNPDSIYQPTYVRDIAARDAAREAATEGFKRGLRDGVLKGDSLRGLIRGGANATADTIDFMYDAPVRSMFAPTMLLAKLVSATTGNKTLENGVRSARDSQILVGNWLPHQVSKGYRSMANSKMLDPKHLDPVDYALAEKSGRGAVVAGTTAIEMAMPGAATTILAAAQMPDIITTAGNQVLTATAAEMAKNAPQSASAVKPRRGTPVWDAVRDVEALRAERRAFWVDAKEAYKAAQARATQVKEQQKAQQKKDQRFDQSLAAGVGGFLGLVGAHQITKRIPVLQRKRILRYLINTAAAAGAGTLAWKAMGR